MGARKAVTIGLAVLLTFAFVNGVELEGLDAPDQVVETPASQPVDLGGEPQNPEQCREQCMLQDDAQPAKPRATVPSPKQVLRNWLAAGPTRRPTNFYLEAAALAVAAIYIAVAYWGNRANGRIAEAFARCHCIGESALFPRQFALCGAGEVNAAGYRTPILKESTYTYKFYASGRRHCEGCLAMLNLLCRADLLSWVLQLFAPAEDLLEIEVYMNEANMPTTVLAVGTPRQVRALSSRADVGSYAKPVKPNSGSIPASVEFPAKKLQVLAEHAGLFTELLADPRIADAFASPQNLRLFRSLLVTSEAGGPHKRLLRLVLAVPAQEEMRSLGPLLAMLPSLIDIVGNYKLTPELKKRAAEVRAKAEAASGDAEEARKRRLEALQRRRVEKVLEEKERLARMAPEARRRAEEKLAAKAAKKSMKMKMVRQ